MTERKKRPPRLGRGLSSLMSTEVPVDEPADASASTSGPSATDAGGDRSPASSGLRSLPVAELRANPHQPRQSFSDEGLESLAESIRSAGVMQPVVVRAAEEGWEIVAGERRWRAARQAGLETIPAIVRELDEQQMAEWALIENLQREDLNPLERAEAFAHLADSFDLDHGAIADRVGVNRVTVTNALRLLTLADEVQQLVRDGHLSNGQAKALAGVENAERQIQLARHAVREGWSVRVLEAAVREVPSERGEQSAGASGTDGRSHRLIDLERQIADQLQTKVSLKPGRKKGTGTLTIRFFSLDQFDGLLDRLGVDTD